MFSTVEGSVRLVIAVTKIWFITEDVGIIAQTRGRGSHSLIWPSRLCVAEQGIPVFKDSSLKQGIQYHDLAS